MKSPSTNKRTQALKAIAKRNFQAGNMSISAAIQVASQATASDAALDVISSPIPDAFSNPIPRSIPGTIPSTAEAHSTSRTVSLLDIKEDLLDAEQKIANDCHNGVGATVMPSPGGFTPTNSTRTKGAKNTAQTNATAVTTNLSLSIELLYTLIKKTIMIHQIQGCNISDCQNLPSIVIIKGDGKVTSSTILKATAVCKYPSTKIDNQNWS